MRIGVLPFLHNDSGGTYQYSITMLKALYEWKRSGSTDEFVIFAHDTEHPVLAEFPEFPGWQHVPAWGEVPPPPPPPSQKVVDFFRRVVGEGPHRNAWRWVRRKVQGLPDPEPQQIDPVALALADLPLSPAEPATDAGNPLDPLTQEGPDPDNPRFDLGWDAWFRHYGVEIVIHHGPGGMPFEVSLPYILAIHDLQHRLQPEFPEVSADGEWHSREYFFRNGCRYATHILVDSEVGKEDVLNFYGAFGIEADRVKVLPFLPACYLKTEIPAEECQRVRAAYQLPDRYLFYPAQIWPHKNHARLVRAIAQLKNRGVNVPLVCCGSAPDEVRQRALAETKELARQVGAEDLVRFLGYIPDGDMSGLFGGAEALIFPTFFGPTNIPPLEAWSLGCPVITSDIRGIREQMGEAAVLVDPRSEEAMAAGIERLWTDPALRQELITRGRQRLASYTPVEYGQRLREILEEAKFLIKSGKAPSRPHPEPS